MKKILSLLFGALYFLIFVFGIRVKALELVEEPIDNVWYFRKGGGISSFSAQFKYYSIDGKTTYCIEPGEHITTHSYEETQEIDSPYSNEINDLIGLIGYYGYDYPGHNTDKYRMATQALIWEKINGQTVEYWTKPSGAGTFISVEKEKKEIMNLVNSHAGLPSFKGKQLSSYVNNAVSFTDTTNNLSYFKVVDSEDYDYSISGNVLTIIPKKIGLIEVNIERDTYTKELTIYFVGIDNKSQTMGYFGINQYDKFKIYVNSRGGTITLNKIDSYNFNSVPRGDAKLEGAVYAVYDSLDNKVDEIVINSSGVGKSKMLPLGTYTVKEIKPSLGYKLDTNTHSFTISKSNLNPSKKVTEWVISGTVELFKVLNDKKTGVLTPEKNIMFEFYLKSTGKLQVRGETDEDGFASYYLPYGVYTVKQVNSNYGYDKVDDFEIEIKDSSYIRKVIADGVNEGSKLKVIKRDLDTNNIISRDGIKFKIKNLDTNEYVCQSISYPDNKTICEYETKNGIFITPEKIELGNYELEELDEVMDGYLLNSDKIKFTIDDNSKDIIEINFYNKEVKGSLEINKYGEEMIMENNNYHYEDILLDDISFELYTGSDIYSQDGTLIYPKDTLVKEFKINNGSYNIDNLYLGSYYIKEVNCNNEYNMLTSPFYFDINYLDQYTPLVKVKIDLKNNLKKGEFILTKKDKDTNELIEGATIDFYNDKDELIYEGVSDNLGIIKLSNLKVGKYYYIEKEANLNYILDNTRHYFAIKDEGEVVEQTLYNEKIKVEPVKEDPKDNIVTKLLNNTPQEDIIEEVIDVPITYVDDRLLSIISIIFILIGITNIYAIKKYS